MTKMILPLLLTMILLSTEGVAELPPPIPCQSDYDCYDSVCSKFDSGYYCTCISHCFDKRGMECELDVHMDSNLTQSYFESEAEKYVISQVPGRRRSLDVYTSRGCPYNCIFCYNYSFNKSQYRKKNINATIQEIEWLVRRYHLDSIYINDDIFFVDTERSHHFCNCLIDRKIVPEWGPSPQAP